MLCPPHTPRTVATLIGSATTTLAELQKSPIVPLKIITTQAGAPRTIGTVLVKATVREPASASAASAPAPSEVPPAAVEYGATGAPVTGPGTAGGDAGGRDSSALPELLDESLDFEQSTGLPSEMEPLEAMRQPAMPRGEGASGTQAQADAPQRDGAAGARRGAASEPPAAAAELGGVSDPPEQQAVADAGAGLGRCGADAEGAIAQGPVATEVDRARAAWGGAGWAIAASERPASSPIAIAAAVAADVRPAPDASAGVAERIGPPSVDEGVDEQPAPGRALREPLPRAEPAPLTPSDEARRDYESAAAQLARARAELEKVKAQIRGARAPPPPSAQGERGGFRGELAKLDAQLDEVHGRIAEMMDRRDELTSRLARHYHRAPSKVGSSVFAPILRPVSAPATHKAPWKAGGPTFRTRAGAHRPVGQAEDEAEALGEQGKSSGML